MTHHKCLLATFFYLNERLTLLFFSFLVTGCDGSNGSHRSSSQLCLAGYNGASWKGLPLVIHSWCYSCRSVFGGMLIDKSVVNTCLL